MHLQSKLMFTISEDGVRQGISTDDKAQDEVGPGQRAGPTVPSLLLSAVALIAFHCPFK